MAHNPPKLAIIADPAPATRRRLTPLEQEARLAFIAGKRARGWTVARTAQEGGVSTDSVERYISGRRAVPGHMLVVVGATQKTSGTELVNRADVSAVPKRAERSGPRSDDGGKTPRSGATGIQHSPNDGGHASGEVARTDVSNCQVVTGGESAASNKREAA